MWIFAGAMVEALRTSTDYLAVMLKDVRRAQLAVPDANWTDALAYGQLSSKIWLVDELSKVKPHIGKTLVCAGWLGTLAMLLFYDERLLVQSIVSVDIDDQCETAARVLNQHNTSRFSAQSNDIFELEYSGYDTIINTSCDHIVPFSRWYSRLPHGRLVVLQNNNFHEADSTHINTIETVDQLIEHAPMTELLFAGQRGYEKYTRYMVIGVR